MEIQSKLERRTVALELLTIHLSYKERDNLVEVLNALLKKSKPDRLEEYVINGLINALENPVAAIDNFPPKETLSEAPQPERVIRESVVEDEIDKVKIINEVKQRVDPRNEKTMAVFVKESIDYGKVQMNIQTVPKDNTMEAFYDWLVGNGIIDSSGRPTPRR